MALSYPSNTERSSRSARGYPASAPAANRVPIYRDVPHQHHDGTDDASDDRGDGGQSPDTFWGHYVEDRLRHFAQDSR